MSQCTMIQTAKQFAFNMWLDEKSPCCFRVTSTVSSSQRRNEVAVASEASSVRRSCPAEYRDVHEQNSSRSPYYIPAFGGGTQPHHATLPKKCDRYAAGTVYTYRLRYKEERACLRLNNNEPRLAYYTVLLTSNRDRTPRQCSEITGGHVSKLERRRTPLLALLHRHCGKELP